MRKIKRNAKRETDATVETPPASRPPRERKSSTRRPIVQDAGTLHAGLSLDEPTTPIAREELKTLAPPAFHSEVELEDLVSVLSINHKIAGCANLLDLLKIEDNHKVPLARLCLEADLDWSVLIQMFKDYKIDTAAVIAHNRYPKLMENTIDDAMSKTVACSRCLGSGKVDAASVAIAGLTGLVACPDCLGEGTVRKIADRTARLIIYEALGQIKKSKGPLVAIQQNFGRGAEQAGFVTVGQKLIEVGSTEDD